MSKDVIFALATPVLVPRIEPSEFGRGVFENMHDETKHLAVEEEIPLYEACGQGPRVFYLLRHFAATHNREKARDFLTWPFLKSRPVEFNYHVLIAKAVGVVELKNHTHNVSKFVAQLLFSIILFSGNGEGPVEVLYGQGIAEGFELEPFEKLPVGIDLRIKQILQKPKRGDKGNKE